MIKRGLLSIAVGLVVAVGTVQLWQALKHDNDEHISQIAAAEANAARSQLSRNTDRILSQLESMHAFWSTYGSLPRGSWTNEVDIEMVKIPGATTILWDDPAHNARYARTTENPAFDFRPDDNQWLAYKLILSRARQINVNTISGPFVGDNGHAFFEIYIVENKYANSGRLVAILDAHMLLDNLFQDQSPGFAVKVFWEDVLLYERGRPAGKALEEWQQEGSISTSMGSVWRVTHYPTRELLQSYETQSADMILLLGLIISVLIPTLMFENWRSWRRARAAEKAELKLSELNRNLEQVVSARTSELANRTRDMQTITDSVSHDMRSPLSTIAVNVQLFEAQNPNLAPEASTTLQRIPPAVHQIAAILDRMLGLSTVAHSTFQPERLNITDLVEEVFEDLQASEPPPAVDLVIGDLPDCDGDERLVKVLLTNLLSNALKFTRSKPRRQIDISASSDSDATVYKITDNGIGFDQGSAEEMFIAFQKLDEGKVDEGVGLGLAIVARVVGRHGGKIWAEGVPGKSASFFFTLQPAKADRLPDSSQY